jgi:nanoRNase/pAp phosphatase (c-di-AMP/oligoRNAs hydrolase)
MPNKQANIKVSLRSVDGFDTTPITAAFGGGGHAAAGSCILPRTTLQAWQQLAASCS